MSDQNDTPNQNKNVITHEDSFEESNNTQQLQTRLPHDATGPKFSIESRDNQYAERTIQKTKSGGNFSSKQQLQSDDIKNELMNINFNDAEERRALEQYVDQQNNDHKVQRTPIGINLNLNWNSLSSPQKHVIISDRQLKIMEDPVSQNIITNTENSVEGLRNSNDGGNKKYLQQQHVRSSITNGGKSPGEASPGYNNQSSKQYISVYSQKFLKNQYQSSVNNSRENSQQPGMLILPQQSFQQIKPKNLKLALDVFNDKQQIVLSTQSRQHSNGGGLKSSSQRGPQLSNRNQTMNRILSTINKGCTPQTQQKNHASSINSKPGGSRKQLPNIQSPTSSSHARSHPKATQSDLEAEQRDIVDINYNCNDKEQKSNDKTPTNVDTAQGNNLQNNQNSGNLSVANIACRDSNNSPKRIEDRADGLLGNSLLDQSAAHLSSVDGSNVQSRQKLEKINLRVITSSDVTRREQLPQQVSDAIRTQNENSQPENEEDYFLPQSNEPLRKYLLKNYQALSDHRKHFRQYEDLVENGLLTYSINPQERVSWRSAGSQERDRQTKIIQRNQAQSYSPILGQRDYPMAAQVNGNQNLKILEEGSNSLSQHDPKDESVILNIQFQSEKQKQGLMRKNMGVNKDVDLKRDDQGCQKKDSLQEVSVSQINSPMDIVQNMKAKIKGKRDSQITSSSYGATNLFNSKTESLGPFQHKSASSGLSVKRQSRQSINRKLIMPMLVQGHEISAPASTQKLRIMPQQCESPEAPTIGKRSKRSRHSIEVPNVAAQVRVVGTQADFPPDSQLVATVHNSSNNVVNDSNVMTTHHDRYLIPQKQLKKKTVANQNPVAETSSFKKAPLTKEEIFEISSSMFMGIPLSKKFQGSRSKNNLSSQQYMSRASIPAINQSQQIIRPPTVPETMKRVRINLENFASKSNPPKSRQQKRVHMSTQKIGSPKNSKSVVNTTLSHREVETNRHQQSVQKYLKKARQNENRSPGNAPDISVLIEKNCESQPRIIQSSQEHWSKLQQQKYLEETRKKSYSQAKKGMLRFFKGQQQQRSQLSKLPKRSKLQPPNTFSSQDTFCLDSFAMSQQRIAPGTQQQARNKLLNKNPVELENLTKSKQSSEQFDHETELGPEFQQIPNTSGRVRHVVQPEVMLGKNGNAQYQSQQFMILQDDNDRKEDTPGEISVSGNNRDILSFQGQEYKSDAFSLSRPKTQQSRQTFAITQKVMTFCNDYSEKLLGSAANLSISQEQSKDTKNLEQQDEEFFHRRSKFNGRFVRKSQRSPRKGQEPLPTIQAHKVNEMGKCISVLQNQVMLDEASVFDSQLVRLSQASRQSIQDPKQTLMRVNPKSREDSGANIRVSQLSKDPNLSSQKVPYKPQRLLVVKAEDGVSNSFHMSISKNLSPVNPSNEPKHDDDYLLVGQDQLNRNRRHSQQDKPAKEEKNIQILDKFQCVEPNLFHPQTQVARANTFSRAEQGMTQEILAADLIGPSKNQEVEETKAGGGARDRVNSYTDQSMDYQVRQCNSNQKPIGRERDPHKKSFHINSQLTGSSLYTGHKAARLSHDQGQPYFTPHRRSPPDIAKMSKDMGRSPEKEWQKKSNTQRKETDKTERADLSGVQNTSRNEDLTMIDLNYTGFGPPELQEKSTVRKQTHETTPKIVKERSIIPLTPDLNTPKDQSPPGHEHQIEQKGNPFAGMNLLHDSPTKRSKDDINYFSDETQSMLEAKMSQNKKQKKEQYALNNSQVVQITNNYRSTLQLRDQSAFVDSESMARMSMIEGLQSCSGENRMYNPTKFSRRNHLFELTQRSKDEYIQLDGKQRNKTQDLISLQQTQYINSKNKCYKQQINLISNQVARQTHRVITKNKQRNQDQSILRSVNQSLQGQNPIRHALRSEQILQMKAKRSSSKKQEPVYNKIIKSVKEFKNTHNKLKGDAAINEKMKYVVEIQYGSCLSNSRLSYRPQTDLHQSMALVKREHAIVTDTNREQQRVQTEM